MVKKAETEVGGRSPRNRAKTFPGNEGSNKKSQKIRGSGLEGMRWLAKLTKLNLQQESQKYP